MQPRQLKEKTLYRGIIRAAWDMTRRQREYWPLGFLAALLLMNGGAFEFIARACLKISSGAPFDGVISLSQATMIAIASGDSLSRMSLFIMLMLCLAIYAAIVILATAAGGGLIKAASQAALRKNITARAALSSGMAKIGPLFLTQIIGRLAIFAAFTLAALGAFTEAGDAWGNIFAILLFVAFALTALAVSFLMMMTDAGIMISGKGWIHAVHDACRFLRRHWLISIEMIGFVFLVAVGTALAVAAAALVVLIPFTLMLVAVASLHSFSGIMAVTVIYEIIILAAAVIVGAALAVFERCAWSLLYVRLAERGGISKLERFWLLAQRKLHARFRR